MLCNLCYVFIIFIQKIFSNTTIRNIVVIIILSIFIFLQLKIIRKYLTPKKMNNFTKRLMIILISIGIVIAIFLITYLY